MRERLLLGILTFVMGYACFAHGGVTPAEWGACMIAIAGCAFALWFPWRGGGFAPPLHPILLVALTLAPVSAAIQLLPLPVSWLQVIDPTRAELLAGLNGLGGVAGSKSHWAAISVAPPVTFAELERILTYITMFFLAREFSWRMPARQWLLAVPVVMVGTLEAALGLAQYFGGAGRATGTWVNPNHFASMLHMAFPLAAMLAVRNVRRRAVALSCLLMTCSAAILFAAFCSLSRMGLATVLACSALLAGAGLAAKLRGGTKWLALLAPPAIIGCLLGVAPLPLWDRFSQAQGGLDITNDLRFQLWKEAGQLAAAYPAFGSGLGTYRSAIQQFRNSAPLGLVEFAHNDYLQLFVEMGAVGIVPWLVSAVWIFAAPWRAALAGARARHRLLALACGVSLAAIALDSLVDFNFYVPANMVVASWIAGVGSGLSFRRQIGAGPSYVRTVRRSS